MDKPDRVLRRRGELPTEPFHHHAQRVMISETHEPVAGCVLVLRYVPDRLRLPDGALTNWLREEAQQRVLREADCDHMRFVLFCLEAVSDALVPFWAHVSLSVDGREYRAEDRQPGARGEIPPHFLRF